mmetsp:Transcript_19665/g.53955  ORF Transcript_19665/g.53955 Transcript_19665/m.53955 type:complete len:204 (+) Transcript_19665:193-804(+)
MSRRLMGCQAFTRKLKKMPNAPPLTNKRSVGSSCVPADSSPGARTNAKLSAVWSGCKRPLWRPTELPGNTPPVIAEATLELTGTLRTLHPRKTSMWRPTPQTFERGKADSKRASDGTSPLSASESSSSTGARFLRPAAATEGWAAFGRTMALTTSAPGGTRWGWCDGCCIRWQCVSSRCCCRCRDFRDRRLGCCESCVRIGIP